MEDVLDVYELPYNPKVPVVCMDEKPYQLLGEVRDSWAMRPGDNRKVDSEYVRKGTCSIFAFIEPLGGRHHTSVREHRTAVDSAEEIKYMVDEMYPEAEKIILVMDNLNTHPHYIRLSSQRKHVESSRSLKFTILPSTAAG